MNKKIIQMNICKALVDGEKRLCKAKINDDEIMITTDGFSAFVLFEKECIFDLSKIPEKSGIATYLKDDETDEELSITNKRFLTNKANVVKMVSSTQSVYANECIVKHFEKYRLFVNKQCSRIIAKNDLGMTVGVFCPIRFIEEN